jgi:hypothetical protein
MTTFYRRWDRDEDPEQLLDPEKQWSTPWGGADHGSCDKCHGRRRCHHRCLSCLEDGWREDCPACGGRVEYEDVCPTCEGTGMIDRTTRRGVSVFPSPGGLYRYLAERDAELEDAVILSLDADPSGDRDLDADSGAVLVIPSRVIETAPVDGERIAALGESVA